MGEISIDVRGSFKKKGSKVFSAQKSGHVVAAEDAISWLFKEILRSAEVQDRDLRLGKTTPDDEWAEFDKRHPMTTAMPGDVVAEKSFDEEIITEPHRYSHCSFSNCAFKVDCVFTDCAFEDCTVRGEFIKCNFVDCEITAQVFLRCKAVTSDVMVCRANQSWDKED